MAAIHQRILKLPSFHAGRGCGRVIPAQTAVIFLHHFADIRAAENRAADKKLGVGSPFWQVAPSRLGVPP